MGQVIFVDSHVFGDVVFDCDGSLLEITRSEVTGSVSASGRGVRMVIAGSRIKGEICGCGGIGRTIEITDTTVEGGISADHSVDPFIFDGLQLHGELQLDVARAHIRRSYIKSPRTAAALFLQEAAVTLETTFVQGALALAADASSRLESSSSVVAGPISAAGTAVLSCTDTYGADYELLSASCQPQVP